MDDGEGGLAKDGQGRTLDILVADSSGIVGEEGFQVVVQTFEGAVVQTPVAHTGLRSLAQPGLEVRQTQLGQGTQGRAGSDVHEARPAQAVQKAPQTVLLKDTAEQEQDPRPWVNPPQAAQVLDRTGDEARDAIPLVRHCKLTVDNPQSAPPSCRYLIDPIKVEAGEIRRIARFVTYGWGVIPVEATINGVTFTTSLFPKDDTYLLPIKAAVRRKAGVTAGDDIDIEMAVHGVAAD